MAPPTDSRVRAPRALFAALLVLAALAVLPARAAAAPSEVGYDVSYPQCLAPLPIGAAFGLVGVNGGLANNANPCLAAQVAWARAAPGRPARRQPSLSLYLDTADPGNTVPDWPSPLAGTAGPPSAYGTCDGGWSAACAFAYGQQRGAYSYALAVTAGAPAGSTPWWLDVETGESWAGPGTVANWKMLNVVALRGFAAGLRDSGARATIGLYSNAREWRAITGLDPRQPAFVRRHPAGLDHRRQLLQRRAGRLHAQLQRRPGPPGAISPRRIRRRSRLSAGAAAAF